MMYGTTEKQRIVWQAILDFQNDQETLPSLKEIRTRVSMPSGILVDRVGALISRGFVERHGRFYKALPPPHEAIVARVCEACRTSLKVIQGDNISAQAVRVRKLISKELLARNYHVSDIAALLNKDRNTIYYYTKPRRAEARAEYDRRRRIAKKQRGAAPSAIENFQ